MAACFQLYKKTTLPPLLDHYLPGHHRNQNSKNQEKIEADPKNQMKNNKQALSDEEKDEIVKRTLKEQHHLETFKNLYKLRSVLGEHYRTLLNEKVQKQRIQIKMSNLRVQQHVKHPHKKYIPRHKVPFCKLSHDVQYLESIPKSSSYLIIGLQNELTKHGLLKNQEDYENFWKLAQEGVHGSELKEMLPDIKAKMFAVKPSPLSCSARTNLVKHHKGFTNINRLEQTMSTSLLQSAGTCQLSTHHMNKQMTTQTPNKEKVPKRLLSWLSEVQKKHGEQPSRTQQVSQKLKRSRRYERHLHYLQHMYYFSLVNMASSKRLLEKNGQFSDVKTEQSIHDLSLTTLHLLKHGENCYGQTLQLMSKSQFTLRKKTRAALRFLHQKKNGCMY
ncbi:uncharacterized protein LOC143842570 isoform X2 [Paroedura picta]|uniref:uncharacterized protein LOC143842570 isoform X2 n=1 Tax=Paroedura picta TaxID=143630 RepID=UPI00405643EE